MAVDFAVPLITNVKCAKLLIEALVRNYPLDISNIDAKTSHSSYTLPELINSLAFVPNIATPGSADVAEVTRASIAAGFNTTQLISGGALGRIIDAQTLAAARSNVSGSSHCNYALSFTASASNAPALIDDVVQAVKSLFIPFSDVTDLSNANKVASVASYFSLWPSDKPIITDAKGTDLASILLIASLHSRSVHVVNVSSKDDILLIKLSKEKKLKVTCDVAVYSLFFTTEEYPGSTCLPTAADQAALWSNLDVIDVFAVGQTPYQLAAELGKDAHASAGIEETLPLLLTAVSEGRLTLEGIARRLHDNPAKIFDLPEQPHGQTYVEVVVGRKVHFSSKAGGWSPLTGKMVSGAVHRVVVNNATVVLDGVSSSKPTGQDVSAAAHHHHASRQQQLDARSLVPENAQPSFFPPAPTSERQAPATQLVPRQTPGPIQGPFAPITPHPAFHRKHILSVKQFGPEDLYDLFNLAHEMRLQVERNGTIDLLKGRVLCTLFYEASTRTSSSFEAAMKRCGGEVLQINLDRSSVQKGESLADTIRTVGCYADAIVLRHPAVGSVQNAAKYSPVPVINAGDGIGEHPTQVGD